MAGSYGHVVDDQGRLETNETIAGMLENGGDVYEAVEQMYGMIWYLATQSVDPVTPVADLVERARDNYWAGIAMSPGRVES